jgi:FdhD protein
VTGLERGVPAALPARRAVTPVQVVAVRPGRHLRLPERVATEEPMEIRVAGPAQASEPVAVTMRTPGHDFELAAGFLYTEGLVGPDDIAAVKYCELPDDEDQRYNVVTVELRRSYRGSVPPRSFPVGASCGLCGAATIDAVERHCAPVAPGPPVPASVLHRLPDRLRARQRLFDETGGLHGAALFDADGSECCAREDVGRHNAVDKVVGHGLLGKALPLSGQVLMVSGRVSFEIVQKAAMAGVPVVGAVSAPTSLAVDAGERLGVTVAGFIRGGRYNIYSHPERVDLAR